MHFIFRGALVLAMILFSPVFSIGQLKFNIKSFEEKFQVAEWLYEYDLIAWRTSDSILAAPQEEQARLGREWFCFKEGDLWHAAYGNFDQGKYDLIFHYTVDTNFKVIRVRSSIDTGLLNSYSRALIHANGEIQKKKDSINVRFNQFVKRNADKSLSVWFMPAFSTDGVAVYGGEFYYRYDPAGNHLLDRYEYFKGSFRGFKADNPREIWLNYRDVDEPTLGSIFFVWYYKKYFTRINIDTRKSTSAVFYEPDKGYYWVHAEKE